MQIRLEQQSLDAMKKAMQKFLPHYFNDDINFPTEYEFDFGLYFNFLTWHFLWTNIEYTNAKLDVKDIKLELTNGFDIGLIKVNMPLIE